MADTDISQAVEDGKFIIEYVTAREKPRNFWPMDTADDVEHWYQVMLQMIKYQKRSHLISVGSESFIMRVRVGIIEGELDPSSVAFLFERNLLTPNRCGDLDNWPVGFCAYHAQLCGRALRGAVAVRKKARQEGVA